VGPYGAVGRPATALRAVLLRSLVAAGALALLPFAAGAADEPEPIAPDRVSASTTTGTVGRGAFQLEAGVAYERERIGGRPSARR
jgi:hypothetical protein